jgi:xyloglucan-specific exo-beta-1,4-glucanase
VSPSVPPPYHSGDVVTLTESPSVGYTFSAWSGDGVGTGSTRSVTVSGDMSVTATFTEITYALSVFTAGSGSGSISLSPMGGSYSSGTVVTLTANPSGDSSFTSWGGDLSGSSNPTTITMDSAKSVTANFALITYTLAVSKAGSGTGSVSLSPGGGIYASGTVVTLTPTPGVGSSFTNWGLDLSGSSNPTTITMDSAKSVEADFALIEYTVSVSASAGGAVSKSPSQSTYHYGDLIMLTATPAGNYTFTGWSGSLTGSANPYSFTVDGDLSVMAIFVYDGP